MDFLGNLFSEKGEKHPTCHSSFSALIFTYNHSHSTVTAPQFVIHFLHMDSPP
ncbi:hypothetical protein B4133_0741 [Bacillus altitudinis]|nr:hypothetical protein B4133_0741 [Bacillus altitudinis]